MAAFAWGRGLAQISSTWGVGEFIAKSGTRGKAGCPDRAIGNPGQKGK
jgi:hypothetical protein